MPALAVADTSFVVAVFNRRDKHYAEASTFYHVSEQEILLPSVTLTEVAYHLMVLGGGRLVSDALVEIR